MRHLTPDQYIRMPWRNGDGTTTQIAVDPDDRSRGRYHRLLAAIQLAEEKGFEPLVPFGTAVFKVDPPLFVDGKNPTIDGSDIESTASTDSAKPAVAGEKTIQDNSPEQVIANLRVGMARAAADGRYDLAVALERQLVRLQEELAGVPRLNARRGKGGGRT